MRESGFVKGELRSEQYSVNAGIIKPMKFREYKRFEHRAVILTTPNGETRGEVLDVRDGALSLTGVRVGDAIEIAGDYAGTDNVRRKKYRRYWLIVYIDDRCVVVEVYKSAARLFRSAALWKNTDDVDDAEIAA